MEINFRQHAEKIVQAEGFFFIAEVSNNHLGDLERLKRIIEAAKDSGAHAVKIQTYSADSLCLETAKLNHYIDSGPWAGQSYWDLYKSMEIPLEWSLKARDYADSIDIPLFSSPFSPKDVRFLAENGFSMVKVASGELGCPELIDAIIEARIPFIASTGFAGVQELDWLHNRLSNRNQADLLWCLFNCVSNYPATVQELNVAKFGLLKRYSERTGLSDHSLDNSCCMVGLMAGARIFEKHLTLSRGDGGPDAFFSLEPSEMRRHINELKSALMNPTIEIGSLQGRQSEDVGKARVGFSRSVYAKRNIAYGTIITKEDVGSFRPSHEEPAINIHLILGRRAKANIRAGDPVFASSVS